MNLAKEIYTITDAFPSKETYGLTAQMRSAAVSIPSNIAEGSQRRSDKDFANFLLITRGSLAELQTQIMLANEFRYTTDKQHVSLCHSCEELSRMLYGFLQSLQKKAHSS